MTLESIVFNIFMNDLATGTECSPSKFTDDKKLEGAADTPNGCVVILRRTSTDWRSGLRAIL